MQRLAIKNLLHARLSASLGGLKKVLLHLMTPAEELATTAHLVLLSSKA
jgi:hypothetical protein